jgi:hypothetical protein
VLESAALICAQFGFECDRHGVLIQLVRVKSDSEEVLSVQLSEV